MASGFDLTATARSLLNIEVNTIVRDNMTGEPMPPAPHALLDIAGEYAAVLCELGIDLPSYFRQGAGDPAAIITLGTEMYVGQWMPVGGLSWLEDTSA